MNHQQRINQIKEEISHLEEKIKNCRHEFNDAIYDPEEINVQDDWAGYEEHGVDRFPKLSFHKEMKSRWSRECKHCGHKDYTYEQKPIVQGYKLYFY
jgi:hypothetical protein